MLCFSIAIFLRSIKKGGQPVDANLEMHFPTFLMGLQIERSRCDNKWIKAREANTVVIGQLGVWKLNVGQRVSSLKIYLKVLI